MWEVHYSLEAANYLADNSALISGLYWAMESLADTDGMPSSGEYRQLQGLVYWTVHWHEVVYRRTEAEWIVGIILIKPD